MTGDRGTPYTRSASGPSRPATAHRARGTALLSYALSAVLLVGGVLLLAAGRAQGWAVIALAVLYTTFIVGTTRLKARQDSRDRGAGQPR